MATIIMDSRENCGANPFLESIVLEYNIKSKHTILLGEFNKNIVYGDYAILIDNMVACIIERKTWKDLAGSIKDNRFTSQFDRMVRYKNLRVDPLIYYIIEGPLSYVNSKKINGISFNGLHNKILSSSIKGINYLQSKSASETANLLVKLANQFILNYKNEHFKLNFQTKGKKFAFTEDLKSLFNKYDICEDQVEDVLKLINIVDAPIIGGLESLKIVELTSDNDIKYKMWLSLSGVSENTAIILSKKYQLKDIFLTDKQILLSEISELKYLSGIRIGTTRASNILDSNTSKILSCIPGITLKTSDIILQKYKFEELFTLDAKSLSSVNIVNRKLGIKKAAKIISILQNVNINSCLYHPLYLNLSKTINMKIEKFFMHLKNKYINEEHNYLTFKIKGTSYLYYNDKLFIIIGKFNKIKLNSILTKSKEIYIESFILHIAASIECSKK